MMNLASRFSKILEKIKILDESILFLRVYTVLHFGQADWNRDISSPIEAALHTWISARRSPRRRESTG